MNVMAKSEKPASVSDPKPVLKKSVTPKAAQPGPPSRAKLPWAQAVSRATAPKPSQRPAAAAPKPSPRPSAKPPQRSPGRLAPPPLPKVVDADAVIEVSTEWLEEPSRRFSKRPSKPAKQLRFVEAVRVLVGPNGELEVFPERPGVPNGYIDALLVATSAGLAERLLKR
jgi:hypothetical protein